MSEEEQGMTPARARMILAADKEKRMKACSEEIAAALKRHGCNLVAVPMLSPDGRIVARVQVIGEA